MVSHIIYSALCTVTGKRYIGLTKKSLKIRKSHHFVQASKDSPFHFHRGLRKHGGDSFIWEVIGVSPYRKSAEILEKLFIQKFDSFKNGYNMTLGGDGSLGVKASEETKRKMSVSRKKWKLSEESVKKGAESRRGQKRTEEQKMRMCLGQRNSSYVDSRETKLKKSLAKMGVKNNSSKGYLFTPLGQFESSKLAGIAHKITPRIIRYRCSNVKHKDYYYEKDKNLNSLSQV